MEMIRSGRQRIGKRFVESEQLSSLMFEILLFFFHADYNAKVSLLKITIIFFLLLLLLFLFKNLLLISCHMLLQLTFALLSMFTLK